MELLVLVSIIKAVSFQLQGFCCRIIQYKGGCALKRTHPHQIIHIVVFLGRIVLWYYSSTVTATASMPIIHKKVLGMYNHVSMSSYTLISTEIIR